MITVLIICLIVGILCIYFSDWVEDIPSLKIAFRIMGLVIIFSCGGMFNHILYNQDPSAMDVYQGKTTLEITYRDSIPVDSTVVFKK